MEPFRQNPRAWNALVARLPHAHFLQTWQWGQVKAAYGWQPHPVLWKARGEPAAAALVLRRRGPWGLTALYAPRGPVLPWSWPALRGQVLADLEAWGRRAGALFVKIDPDLPVGYGLPDDEDAQPNPTGIAVQGLLQQRGWQPSEQQVQFPNTMVLDLTLDEDQLLARMKQKTRYNIRLAARKGVRVRLAQGDADWDLMYRMYAQTAARDGFVIRPRDYYLRIWHLFTQANMGQGFIAEVEGEAVAAAFVPHFAKTGWFFHGMSTRAHREKMPNYALQWAIIRWLKAQGCTRYDLWGVPTQFHEADPLWGVWGFKRGFRGQIVRTLGAWDYLPRPWAYHLFQRVWPRALAWMRRRAQRSR
ncbi:MAG: peptidoglycan bridge formation glycyltransferase FemA/FemB family protein [Chloroflexi bacterium]|nr:peptidoglycan bridge formation glycyltransferase FemA/FemB family protein [Chloroflexota bacterium]